LGLMYVGKYHIFLTTFTIYLRRKRSMGKKGVNLYGREPGH
jgi:hypothetical protein